MEYLMQEIKVWEICDGEHSWIAAYDRDDACLIYVNQFMEVNSLNEVESNDLACPLDELDVREVDFGEALTFTMDCGDKETKTAFEWSLDGRGLIASSCY
jgi:dipeptidase